MKLLSGSGGVGGTFCRVVGGGMRLLSGSGGEVRLPTGSLVGGVACCPVKGGCLVNQLMWP